jgi:Tfp pilus assembly protein FimT
MKTCGVKNFFSLIELLLVVGIMALLMGISLPAFSKMVRGSGTKLTTRNIVAKVNAARSYAITTRSNVAILFPSDGVSNANFYYTHYRVCKVYKDGSNWKWLSWIEARIGLKYRQEPLFNTSPLRKLERIRAALPR